MVLWALRKHHQMRKELYQVLKPKLASRAKIHRNLILPIKKTHEKSRLNPLQMMNMHPHAVKELLKKPGKRQSIYA